MFYIKIHDHKTGQKQVIHDLSQINKREVPRMYQMCATAMSQHRTILDGRYTFEYVRKYYAV